MEHILPKGILSKRRRSSVFKHRGIFGQPKYDIKSSSFEGKTIKPWTRLDLPLILGILMHTDTLFAT